MQQLVEPGPSHPRPAGKSGDSPLSTRAGGDVLRDLGLGCARADRDAFDRVHARFDRGLRALFMKRGVRSQADLDELSQQTWLGVWRALSSGRYDPERAAISTFVYAVAIKTWLRQAARRGAAGDTAPERGGFDEDAAELVGHGDDEPAAALIGAERLEALRRCIYGTGGESGLTADEREAVMGAALGASDRELAAQLGVAPSTINARKQAGWGKVRRMLSRLGFGGESGEREPASEE